MIFVNR